MKIKVKKPIEQIIYEALKNAILQRVLAPGTQLVENTISEKFNASRTPIRNALKRLASEGLIDIIPNKGSFVIHPSLADIIKAYEIRAELECIALKFSVNKVTEADIVELRNLVDKELVSVKNKDVNSQISLNKEFHMFLSKKGDNKYLQQFVEEIIDRIDMYLQIFNTVHSANLDEISRIKDHNELIDLLVEKDMNKLELLLRKHLNESLRDLDINKTQYKSLDELF